MLLPYLMTRQLPYLDKNNECGLFARNSYEGAYTTLFRSVWLALIGTMLLRPSEQECVAYISGNRTTDPQQVLQAMQQSIDQMEQADKVPSVENQLNDMFQQLPPEQVK